VRQSLHQRCGSSGLFVQGAHLRPLFIVEQGNIDRPRQVAPVKLRRRTNIYHQPLLGGKGGVQKAELGISHVLKKHQNGLLRKRFNTFKRLCLKGVLHLCKNLWHGLCNNIYVWFSVGTIYVKPPFFKYRR
jgi:hypothetical protein